MSREQLRFEDYLLLTLLMGLFVAFSLFYNANQKFSFDQVQMLLKGFNAVINGEYLPFGNETTVMGNIPGKLSSWLIGFPLKLFAQTWSIVVFQLLLRLLAIALFINALGILFERKIVLLGTFLFALSPWVLYQTVLYNQAYLLFGSVLALNALVHLRSRDSNSRSRSRRSGGFDLGSFFYTFILVLAIGYCFQLQFSWPILVAITLFMWLRRDIKFSYIGLALGCGLMVWLLLPYCKEVLTNTTLLTNTNPNSSSHYLGYGLVHVYPLFLSLLYWFRFGSLLIMDQAIYSGLSDNMSLGFTIVHYAWIGFAFLVGGLSLLYAVYGNYFVMTRFRVSNSSERLRFVRGLTISSIWAVFLVSAISPMVLNLGQISLLLPFALLPVLAFMSVRPMGLKLYFWVAVIFFALANGIGSTNSEKFDYHQQFSANVYRTCLLGFSAQQCENYAQSLSAEQVEMIKQQTKQDPRVIKRVLEGIIPAAEDNFVLNDPSFIQLFGGDSVTPVIAPASNLTVPKNPAAAPVVSVTVRPNAQAQVQAQGQNQDADKAVKADKADKVESQTAKESGHEIVIRPNAAPAPAPVTPSQPATQITVREVPHAAQPIAPVESKGADKGKTSSGKTSGRNVIIDKGNGASGELIIN